VPVSLAGRSVRSITDLSREEIEEIWAVAAAQKSGQITREEQLRVAPGRSLALLFDKSSLRTRIGFEVAMAQLGGHGVYLAPADVRLGQRETVEDAARVLGRTVDAITARLSSHEFIIRLADSAGVPVINAMSDREHPCQALADLFTVREHKGDLGKVVVAWVGDGFNVCNSLMLISALFGVQLRVATPPTYEPPADIVSQAMELAAKHGSSLSIGNDPAAAVQGADVIYTDVWVSAGMEEQAIRRRVDFQGFQLNPELVRSAKPDSIFLHCLPAHRGEEITDAIMDSERCAAFDQAENRLHTQRALLTLIFS